MSARRGPAHPPSQNHRGLPRWAIWSPEPCWQAINLFVVSFGSPFKFVSLGVRRKDPSDAVISSQDLQLQGADGLPTPR